MPREVSNVALHPDKAPAGARLRNMVPVQVTAGGETQWVWREGVAAEGYWRQHPDGDWRLFEDASAGRKFFETPAGTLLSKASGDTQTMHVVSDGAGGWTLSYTGPAAAYVVSDGAGGYTVDAGASSGFDVVLVGDTLLATVSE